jgi:peptidoglycan/LPS O-acetylase OafA/YrhL
MTQASAQHRSRGLDGLRGLAALSVFLFHVWLYNRAPGSPIGNWDYAAAQLSDGLICFFVLSGFLLYRPFVRAASKKGDGVTTGPYFLRRAARILPAYYVALLGTLALLTWAKGTQGVRLPDTELLPLFVLFAQNYHPDTILTLNPVTWTLCLEMAFYIELPLIGLFALRVARGRMWPQIALLVTFIVAGMGWNALTEANAWSQIATKSLVAYMPYFAFGMLAALWAEHRRAQPASGPLSHLATWGVAAAGLAIVAANAYWHATITLHDGAGTVLRDLPSGAGFALLTAAAAAGAGPALGWLRAAPLRNLGVVSYGFYLWHVPILLGIRHTGVATRGWWLLVIAFPLCLAAGTASWFIVEKPLIAMAHGRLVRRDPSRRPQPAVTPG